MTEQDTKPEDIVQKTIADLGPVVGTLALIAMIVPIVGGFTLIGYAGSVRDALETEGNAPYIYGAIFAVCTGFALLPTYALSAVAGYIFGATLGSTVSLSGIVAGSMIGYIIAALLARARVMRVIDSNPKAKVIRSALVEGSMFHRFFAVTLIRLPPNSPFAITNFVMSSVRVNPIVYAIGTAIGIAPRTVLACVLGAGIAQAGKEITDADGKSLWQKIAVIAVSLVLFLAIYALFSKWSKDALRKYLHDDAPDATLPVDT